MGEISRRKKEKEKKKDQSAEEPKSSRESVKAERCQRTTQAKPSGISDFLVFPIYVGMHIMCWCADSVIYSLQVGSEWFRFSPEA